MKDIIINQNELISKNISLITTNLVCSKLLELDLQIWHEDNLKYEL